MFLQIECDSFDMIAISKCGSSAEEFSLESSMDQHNQMIFVNKSIVKYII